MPKSIGQVYRETKYRMTMRKAMQKSSREELQICLEEVKREIEVRNKQK